MGAVPASGPSYMEHCVSWHLPAMGADIILVEYAVNFDSVSDDAQSFERLIRRLLRLPLAQLSHQRIGCPVSVVGSSALRRPRPRPPRLCEAGAGSLRDDGRRALMAMAVRFGAAATSRAGVAASTRRAN